MTVMKTSECACEEREREREGCRGKGAPLLPGRLRRRRASAAGVWASGREESERAGEMLMLCLVGMQREHGLGAAVCCTLAIRYAWRGIHPSSGGGAVRIEEPEGK